MDCKEFREKISAGNDFDKDLIAHKESCSECRDWIAKELSTAPTGVSEEDWKKAVNKCITTNDNESKSQKESEKEVKPELEENKTFMDYYLSGLKYGIVFGLSIVVGFAIIQNKNEANNLQKTANGASIASESINIASDTNNLSIATDSEIIPLPTSK